MSKFIPILRTGRYKDASGRVYDITPQMLQEIKDNYKSKSAPLVKGHPNADAPSMGWIDQLKLKGEELLASFADISEEFKHEVDRRSFKNVSASFFHPFSESNPNKGKYCLRHVGALGAARPAIPNLGTLQDALAFSEDTEEITAYSEFAEPDKQESLFEKMIKPFIERALKKQREEILAELKASLQRANFSEGDSSKKTNDENETNLEGDPMSDKTARERELEEKNAKLEAENEKLRKEQDKVDRDKTIAEEVAKVKETKNLDEATTKNLTEKASAMADKGVDPKDAVVNLSEFIPEQKKTTSHRFNGQNAPEGKGIASFSEGDTPLENTAEFADEVEKLQKEGLDSRAAYERASRNLSGGK